MSPLCGTVAKTPPSCENVWYGARNFVGREALARRALPRAAGRSLAGLRSIYPRSRAGFLSADSSQLHVAEQELLLPSRLEFHRDADSPSDP